MGGPSSEHEVSLKSGGNVLKFAPADLYDLEPVLIDKEGKWQLPAADLNSKFDLAFIALHGAYGEDGRVQRDLEDCGLKYTGSDPVASALGMNKFLSLQLMKDHGLTVPDTFYVSRLNWLDHSYKILERIKDLFPSPWVVKPNNGGSSFDTFIVENFFDLSSVMFELMERHFNVIVQPYIEGREVTCGVLDFGLPGTAYPLVPTEIIPQKGSFFDFQSKYEVGGSEEITPASFSDHTLDLIRRIAKRTHEIIGCRGMSRTDMIVSPKGDIYVLEINTIPGLTETSLLPQGAQALGISFSELINRVIKSGLNSN